METAEYIVVGSGATGAMAAQTFVDAGKDVLMLDGGASDSRYRELVPDSAFVDLRRTDEQQHRYLLGDDFESLVGMAVKTGAQLTPPRRFLIADVAEFLGVRSDDFAPLESLALGGLAGGWGLGSCVFSPAELERASLGPQEMADAYQVVADRIGISGARDDARAYTSAHVTGIQRPLPIDPTAGALLRRYERKRASLQRAHFSIGRPAMALLSEDRDGRRASAMQDMEFYSDAGRSAWRAWYVIEALMRATTFRYRDRLLVTRYAEDGNGVTVLATDMTTLHERRFRCRRLVLAAGALGSGRIVLRSQPDPTARLPLLCNPYTYIPSVVPSRLGKTMPARNSALSQLAIFHDPGRTHDDVAMGFVYSYRSLMMFRLLREIPLATRRARRILQFLLSGFLIVGVHHPHAAGGDSYIELQPDAAAPTRDRLFVHFELDAAERDRVRERERSYIKCLLQLGAVPMKIVQPGAGSSIHYAGTVPLAAAETPLRSAPDGRVYGTQGVFLADGSPFTYLPAKGLTLTLLARAHVVAKRLLERSA